jgi:hypothetical protein
MLAENFNRVGIVLNFVAGFLLAPQLIGLQRIERVEKWAERRLASIRGAADAQTKHARTLARGTSPHGEGLTYYLGYESGEGPLTPLQFFQYGCAFCSVAVIAWAGEILLGDVIFPSVARALDVGTVWPILCVQTVVLIAGVAIARSDADFLEPLVPPGITLLFLPVVLLIVLIAVILGASLAHAAGIAIGLEFAPVIASVGALALTAMFPHSSSAVFSFILSVCWTSTFWAFMLASFVLQAYRTPPYAVATALEWAANRVLRRLEGDDRMVGLLTAAGVLCFVAGNALQFAATYL